MARVSIARVYDDPADLPKAQQGRRVLVDRIWPRGLRKDDAALDRWLKEVAPSTGLRKWYGHDPAKYDEFARRYRSELDEGDAAAALAELRELAARRRVTLLTASKDLEHSQAAVLAALLNASR